METEMLDLVSEVLSYCPYVLHIFPDPALRPEADQEMFRLALCSLRYNSLEEPEGGDRTLTFVVSDNKDVNSPLVNATVFVRLVNDAPILDLNIHTPDFDNSVSFTEGMGPVLLTNASIIRLVDHDNTHLQNATVRILQAPDNDLEVLNATSDSDNIDISYDNMTSVLTLTGYATVEEYGAVLATVTYENIYSMPGNPDEMERQVLFVVNGIDFLRDSSNPWARWLLA